MKIQAIKNYQTNKTSQQSNLSYQQSFSKLILDERGIDCLPTYHKQIIQTTYEYLKKTLGKLAELPDYDVLIHPYRGKHGECGLVTHLPFDTGDCLPTYFCITELAMLKKHPRANDILDYIWKELNPAYVPPRRTNFTNLTKNKPDFPEYFWNTDLPLPEDVFRKRFTIMT